MSEFLPRRFRVPDAAKAQLLGYWDNVKEKRAEAQNAYAMFQEFFEYTAKALNVPEGYILLPDATEFVPSDAAPKIVEVQDTGQLELPFEQENHANL